MLNRRIVMKGLGATGMAAMAGGRAAFAQGYPSQPITIVVPYAPGATDQATRTLARIMERALKQPIQVENRAGGGATIGASFVARAKPDGYTLLYVASVPITVSPYIRRLPYSFDSFRPVAQGTLGTHLVVARADAPFKTLAEMLAYAKANPGKASIGNSGSAGCIRLFNHDIIDLYERIPMGTRVVIRSYDESVRIEGEALANRGVELPPFYITPAELFDGVVDDVVVTPFAAGESTDGTVRRPGG